jgi:hypothetical protein
MHRYDLRAVNVHIHASSPFRFRVRLSTTRVVAPRLGYVYVVIRLAAATIISYTSMHVETTRGGIYLALPRLAFSFRTDGLEILSLALTHPPCRFFVLQVFD